MSRRIDALEIDLDLRLRKLWVEIDQEGDWDLPTVAAYIRAAYGIGYVDALVEPVAGLLCKTHGYRVPSPPA